MLRSTLALTCAVSSLTLAQAEEVRLKNQPYGEDVRQQFDLYLPDEVSGEKRPLIVFVHGGSWQSGDKRQAWTKRRLFLDRGFAVASLNYRFWPDVTAQGMVEDIAAALSQLIDGADQFGIDEDRIVMIGHSAGAHLVSVLGTNERYLEAAGLSFDDLAAIVSLDTGRYDIETSLEGVSFSPFGGGDSALFGNSLDEWRDVSPLRRVVDGENHPAFLVVAAADRPESDLRTQVRPFLSRLFGAGVQSDFYRAERRSHVGLFQRFGRENDPTTKTAIAFMEDVFARRQASKREDTWSLAPSVMKGTSAAPRPLGTADSLLAPWQEGFAVTRSGEDGLTRLDFYDPAQNQWTDGLIFSDDDRPGSALFTATVETDRRGAPIAATPFLLIGTSQESRPLASRAPRLYTLTPSDMTAPEAIELGTPIKRPIDVSITAFGQHRDSVTGADLVFAAASPASAGIYAAGVAPQDHRRLVWSDQPEFTGRPLEDITGFATCGGHFFAGSANALYRRIDGPRPQWTVLSNLRVDPAVRQLARRAGFPWRGMETLGALHCGTAKGQPALVFGLHNAVLSADLERGRVTVETDLRDLALTDQGLAVLHASLERAATLNQQTEQEEVVFGLSFTLGDAASTMSADPDGSPSTGYLLSRHAHPTETVFSIEAIDLKGKDAATPFGAVTGLAVHHQPRAAQAAIFALGRNAALAHRPLGR